MGLQTPRTLSNSMLHLHTAEKLHEYQDNFAW